MLPVSVIIPAKNESEYLPILLRSISQSSELPAEIIVVDGKSTDSTVAVAESHGVHVVLDGAEPGHSRNIGAQIATQPWLLFLDADVILPPDAIQQILYTMIEKKLTASSTWFSPDDNSFPYKVTHAIVAAYFYLLSSIGVARGIGGCMFIRKQLHHHIGGFNNGIYVSEDLDYLIRAAKVGKYDYLRSPIVIVSTRRFKKNGLLYMCYRWLVHEARLCFGIKRAWKYFPGEQK